MFSGVYLLYMEGVADHTGSMKVPTCRLIIIAFTVYSAARVALPQKTKPFPSYKTQEEYCAANPNMPTCIKLGPLNLSGVTGGQQSKSKPGPARSTVTTVPSAPMKVNAIPVSLTGGKPDWRFAHPNAVALVSLNMRAILSSPLLETVLNQFTGQMAARFPGFNSSDLAKSRAMLSNIERICVSVQSVGAKPEAVALITGRFDDASLASMQLDAASRAKLQNASAILVGDNASLTQASSRMATLSTDDPAVKNAEGWAAQYDIWMMGSTALIPAAMVKSSTGMPDFLSSVRSFSLGMTFSSDLRMDVVLDTNSVQTAAQIADLVRSGAFQQPGLRDPSQNMRVNVNGTSVQIGVSMDQKQLSRRFPGAARRSPGGLGAISGPLFTSEPEAGQNSKPNTVVISGLDGGPKEVKLEEKK
jgi:hypothetical protein